MSQLNQILLIFKKIILCNLTLLCITSARFLYVFLNYELTNFKPQRFEHAFNDMVIL